MEYIISGKEGNKPETVQRLRVVMTKLLDRNMTLCGTQRENKPYIPNAMLSDKEYTKDFLSMFAFID